MSEESKSTLSILTGNINAEKAYGIISKLTQDEIKKGFSKYQYIITALSKDKTGSYIIEFLKRFRLRFKILENELFKIVIRDQRFESVLSFLNIFPKTEEAENIIKNDGMLSYRYACDILKSRFEKGEEAIFSKLKTPMQINYCTNTNSRIKEMEDKFLSAFVKSECEKLRSENYFGALNQYFENFITKEEDNYNHFRKVIFHEPHIALSFARKQLKAKKSDLLEERMFDFEEILKEYMEHTAKNLPYFLGNLNWNTEIVFSYITMLEKINDFKEGYDFCMDSSSNIGLHRLAAIHACSKIKSKLLEDKINEKEKEIQLGLHSHNINEPSVAAFSYIQGFKGERFENLEDLFFKNPQNLYNYAVHLDERIPSAESKFFNEEYINSICSLHHSLFEITVESMKKYHYSFIKKDIEVMDNFYTKYGHPSDLVKYSRVFKKRLSKEAESRIFNNGDGHLIRDYVDNLIDISQDNKIPRIQECEKVIIQTCDRYRIFNLDANFLNRYSKATNVHMKRIENAFIKRINVLSCYSSRQSELDSFVSLILKNYGVNVFFGERWEALEAAYPKVIEHETYKGILSNGNANPKRQRRKSSGINPPQESQSEKGQQTPVGENPNVL